MSRCAPATGIDATVHHDDVHDGALDLMELDLQALLAKYLKGLTPASESRDLVSLELRRLAGLQYEEVRYLNDGGGETTRKTMDKVS